MGSLIIIMLLSSHAIPIKRDIKKLNNLFIFDFFINFELSQKNGNLSTLVDYMPDANNKTYSQITAQSNMGGYAEEIKFQYNDKGNIEKITYQVKDVVYTYDFVYEKNNLAAALIGGKKKIMFTYDFLDRLQSITRQTAEGTMELKFILLEGQNKATIKMFVIRDGLKNESKRNDYIAWNERYKMQEYNFDVYSGKNFNYNAQGDMVSFTYSNVMRDDNPASWEYTYDDNGNWIEKRNKGTYCKRSIVQNPKTGKN
jgi:hypothetical protein